MPIFLVSCVVSIINMNAGCKKISDYCLHFNAVDKLKRVVIFSPRNNKLAAMALEIIAIFRLEK